jgi:hypothetical protein
MSEVYKYLTADYKGPASGKQYGKKDDKVLIVRNDSIMVLVELNGERFHVKSELLTDAPPAIEPDEKKEVLKAGTIKAAPATSYKQNKKPATAKKKVVQQSTQKNLF